MKKIMINRRRFISLASMAAVLPLLTNVKTALAGQNANMRNALKYQNTPSGDKKCSNCSHFIPGANAKALGGCRMLPGDTEISPDAYCNAYAKRA
jgi:hypothetical protein